MPSKSKKPSDKLPLQRITTEPNEPKTNIPDILHQHVRDLEQPGKNRRNETLLQQLVRESKEREK